VIGVVEAHGLAVLTGIAAWAAARLPGRYWHWHLAATHALLGGANIAFFGVFDAVGARTGGIAVTAVHFAFVLVQSRAALSRPRRA
jgi:multisubunit Na+/H+ antiporter MnhG subunit